MPDRVPVVLVPFDENDGRFFIPSEALEDTFTPNNSKPAKGVVAAGSVPEAEFTRAKGELGRASS